ncbi:MULTISPECIES: anaerobic carbon-monoxide dehydrogenase catalytic subunit [unclassified Candidatus Frackibacter]|uniref:anaerobic carbon-monoxide dehydrogenase catalytic subunit n=1 Tax=unclassified Candidatus Frackibacter TaxID=2648818 RepID=UPI0007975030|nr:MULTISPECIES: anaerobic carbon-monoxide dehydrogenase catalytic subunit [unclassified Candidatus Frackibacter]KXS40729.1 MAG: carbon monoxide dehydrogenase 1 [Candidatus Frackibacter sp. T328-2]SDC38444.1 Ni-dependent carbon monoxide dehydrogenase precursor [Candidatus Frackibacter sp. WG11]SEM61858.1 Ni-dependent carbon monoxide dehydrogenase precursor [Candidatus Frackibacter sp. WG12]SFL66124.1 Ni-dependent carbon monoxide dehydrogenase precursor [Candidatus Frackibacter sp. WG13]
MDKCYSCSDHSLINKAEEEGIDLVWDRYEAMQPQCGFGEMGICCRLCIKGPCRIDPYGAGPQEGICGASADTIVARNLVRMIASGTAAHSLHGKEIAKTLLEVAHNEVDSYQVKDIAKLKNIAKKIGINEVEGKSEEDLVEEVAYKTLGDYSRIEDEPCNWLANTITDTRLERLEELDIALNNIESSVTDIMSRTHVGTDADPLNLLLAGLKCGLGDYTGMQISTNLSDVLFGTPEPVVSESNLGVINEGAVNIAVHGHNPLLSEIIVDVADELEEEAIQAGAKDGINIVGVCCTGNEVLLRRGIPLATNYLSQELAILTGAIEAMVVDVQCIMPSLAKISDCYHTELFTTMPDAKIPGATHVELNSSEVTENAKLIVRKAIAAFKRREVEKVEIPTETSQTIAGFSKEAVVDLLSQINSEQPLQPLIDNIVNGNIKGIVLFAGCNNVKVTQDKNFYEMATRLIQDNILVLATGCAAGAFAKNSLMSSQATIDYAGESLKEVLTALGQQAGLDAPLPPIWHMGSCVDNSRGVDLAVSIANELGVDLDQLPLVASAPELMSEKAVSIGTWVATLGIPVHVGVTPPVTGSAFVTEVLTTGLEELLGGYFIVEEDSEAATDKLIKVIEDKREGLNISDVQSEAV